MRYTTEQINSAALDQPHFAGNPRKLLIVCPPRSGSSMLCRMLLTAGIGIPHEYFNELFVRVFGARFGLPGADQPVAWPADITRRYLDLLFACRTRNGLFAAKIQHKHYRLFLQNAVGQALFEGAALVYLTRKNILAQAVSLHFAELTGQWSSDATATTRPKAEQNFFDNETVESCARELIAEQVLWELLFQVSQFSPLRVTYEDMLANPAQIVGQIADFAGVKPGPLPFDGDNEGPYRTDPAQPSKIEVLQYCRQAWFAKQAPTAPAKPQAPAAAGPAQPRQSLAYCPPDPHVRSPS